MVKASVNNLANFVYHAVEHWDFTLFALQIQALKGLPHNTIVFDLECLFVSISVGYSLYVNNDWIPDTYMKVLKVVSCNTSVNITR